MTLSTSPDGPDFTNPNGVPDRSLTEREARWWLLSQGERAAGAWVEFDEESQRWKRAAGLAPTTTDRRCEVCPKIFAASRIDALYCSPACRKKASRKADVTVIGRLISQ